MTRERARGARFQHDGAEFIVLSLPTTPPPLPEGLTPSEEAVMRLVLEGVSSSEIARRRDSSPRTVDNHLRSIFRKLKVGSRRELVARFGR